MHPELNALWESVLAKHGESVAITDAASGSRLRFSELDERAERWLRSNPDVAASGASVWCVCLRDRMQWMAVFLAAIKTGSVFLPVEATDEQIRHDVANRNKASYLIDEQGVRHLTGGIEMPGTLLIKLTSGTTGVPKSLRFGEAEMIADGQQIMCSMKITDAERNYAILPLGHSYALGNLVLPFFMEGVSLVFASAPFPQVMIEEIKRFRCTVLPLVPPLVKALAMVETEPGDFDDLRLVISAGGSLDPKVARQFRENTGRSVHNFYGSSETGGISFDRTGDAALSDGSVGTPLEGVSVSVGDNSIVEVCGPAVCRAICPDGKFATQDYGVIGADGSIRLTGRRGDVVKVAGRRLSLSEVEAALCGIEGVSDAYLTSRKSRSGEMRCIGLYAGEAGPESLRAALAEALPKWKVPRELRRVDRIPYSARGKKDRPALEAMVDAFKRRS